MNYLNAAIAKQPDRAEFIHLEQDAHGYFVSEFDELPPLSPELIQWYGSLPAFDILDLPWAPTDIGIAGRTSLLDKLEGFRFFYNEKAEQWEDEGDKGWWNKNWIVLSLWDEYGIIADMGKPGTPVYYIEFGCGDEPPNPLFDCLEHFDYAFGVWLAMHDEDAYNHPYGGYNEEFCEELESQWGKKLSEQEIEAFCEILPIRPLEDDESDCDDEEDEDEGEEDTDDNWYNVVLESAGENRKEIILELKKELGLDFGEIRKRLDAGPIIITQGFLSNWHVRRSLNLFRSLGAIVRLRIDDD